MQYRTLGKCGIKVSEVGFGAWAIGGPVSSGGLSWGWGEVPEADALSALHRARDLGVNFFDTADVYGGGRSEQLLGKAFAGQWGKLYLATKVGTVPGGKDWSCAHITRSCEESLKRLNKDVLDVYQLHNPDEATIRRGEWAEVLEDLRKQGKIRWYGISVNLPEEALAVMETGAGHVLQVAFNALRQEMAEQALPMAVEHNYGIIARVPLYYGVLTGKYQPGTVFPAADHRSHTLPPEELDRLAARAQSLRELVGANAGNGNLAQWALRFVLAHDAVSTVIPGARNAQQAEDNCRASAGLLPHEELLAARRFWKEDEYLRTLRTGL
jgi:aryl-alcohol dehydrogenase-like predicted oxidoreductase